MTKTTRTRYKVISRSYSARYFLFEENGYGIEAVLYQNGREWDRARVGDITADRCDAERLFEAVADGGVMPCTLRDVVEDWLC